ncbi:764_t:CDS:2, partial [Funneliformis mosseae]
EALGKEVSQHGMIDGFLSIGGKCEAGAEKSIPNSLKQPGFQDLGQEE